VTVYYLRELAVAAVAAALAAAVLSLTAASPRKGDRLAVPRAVDIGPAIEVVARPPAPAVVEVLATPPPEPPRPAPEPPRPAPEPPRPTLAAARPTDICARHGGWRVVTDGGRSWRCAYPGGR
jgi:hypothetical protein